MGRPAGSRNRIFSPPSEEIRRVSADVLSSLLDSRDARIALYDSGRILIDLCYPALSVEARHHQTLYELDPDQLHLLQMEDFDALGKGFKSAALSDVLSLPGTKKIA